MGDDMGITNTRQLSEELSAKLEAAINEISENVYDALIDCIQESIYDYPVGKVYKRKYKNGGFIDAFELSELKKMSRSVTRTLFYNWQKLSLEGNNGYTHGNRDDGIDRRKDLWWILSNRYDDYENSDWEGNLGLQKYNAVPYLELFNATLIRNFDKWVNKALKKQGFYLDK